MKVQALFLFALVLVLTTGCQPDTGPQADAQSLSPASETLAPLTPSVTMETQNAAAQELVRQAQAQLARKLGIEESDIFVFSMETVEWPDASLGCPQAGISYAQVVTPGYRITLEAGGQVYTFHTDETDQVLLCTARGPDEIYLPP